MNNFENFSHFVYLNVPTLTNGEEEENEKKFSSEQYKSESMKELCIREKGIDVGKEKKTMDFWWN